MKSTEIEMTELNTTWISKNGIWKVHKPDWLNGRLMVEDTRIGGVCDYPSLYDGRVYYDYPGSIPGYVKESIARIITGVA